MPAAVILFYDGKVLLNGKKPLWPATILESPDLDIQAILPVTGTFGAEAEYQAVCLATLNGLAGVEPIAVRHLLLANGFEAFSLVGRASQLVNWFAMHRFCGVCGNATRLAVNARVLHCDDCSQDYYPRINPCIIVLVNRGDEILLARSSRRGVDFFSCLAGFIEPGETAEEAVRREVYEEANIQITNIRYVNSQPWPFPSQLMLGFYADYENGELQPDPEELAEAHWYHVTQLPKVPAADISVAGQLIADYCQSIRSDESY